ncbi:S-adenosyl-L-methionine-dependent methyltransferase [Rhizoclosmatium globosum]|uniref:DNA (cytosine-5-)-methyltransferase n=1 Tax=Rhizoclosmatium globosum TaxID=329046 RepID=A0A1Y2B6Y2_9FUNG|nr:S-adenosyl-L-methionine-dependent methyltransferase [Rhizoclosmatium globosum]|eukprot:ORY29865.1 S-adenosyl-L-methionine-dependent methyltransferase [Rhizoclosmatium globosum]
MFEGVPTGVLVAPKAKAQQFIAPLRQLFTTHPNHLAIHLSSSAAVSISSWVSGETSTTDVDADQTIMTSLRNTILADSSITFIPNIRVKSPSCISTRGKQDDATYKHIQTVTIDIEKTRPRFRFIELGRTVFASEIGDAARFTYVSNFGRERICGSDGQERDVLVGDITEVETQDIPEHDVLTAGFPCQSFCKVVRVLKGKKPKAFILENVANLVTMEDGRVFGIIKGHLEDAGYTVHHKIIDASAYTPQTRHRVYIVGFLNPIHSAKFSYPSSPATPPPLLRSILIQDLPPPSLLLTPHQLSKLKESYTFKRTLYGGLRIYKSGYVMYSEFVRVPIDGVEENGGLDEEAEKEFSKLTADSETSQLKTQQDDEEETPKSKKAKTESGDEQALTLRFYSPRECARIMGFPESYRLDHVKNEGTLYHQLGNAVCPPVVEAIARKVIEALEL